MEGDLITREDLSSVRELLQEDLAVGEENNRILKNIRKWQTISLVGKIIIWLIVLAVPVLLYTWLAPIAKAIPTSQESLFGLPTPTQVGAALKEYTGSH